ncbi:hypothetical protein COLO4_05019 [Corchorus olitorius]|uniref:Uncharacterized protein n=1 Tax=Corchorus olitorius TaxID=93759 RepID=A0A1R3KS39_9ROSI|nr:hypothetical protein COLO4_05019 [Corchorus olitorius]
MRKRLENFEEVRVWEGRWRWGKKGQQKKALLVTPCNSSKTTTLQ